MDTQEDYIKQVKKISKALQAVTEEALASKRPDGSIIKMQGCIAQLNAIDYTYGEMVTVENQYYEYLNRI